jgi:hypothetical protein
MKLATRESAAGDQVEVAFGGPCILAPEIYGRSPRMQRKTTQAVNGYGIVTACKARFIGNGFNEFWHVR